MARYYCAPSASPNIKTGRGGSRHLTGEYSGGYLVDVSPKYCKFRHQIKFNFVLLF